MFYILLSLKSILKLLSLKHFSNKNKKKCIKTLC